ncbi:MAG: hypothetical protein M1488_04555 [Gammaproteobacteria bacterium]|jgi:hypothetical protein|nr:hypothetical protein [Gammaproteobacteria bacterium]
MGKFLDKECDHPVGVVLNDADVQLVSGGNYYQSAINSGLTLAGIAGVVTLGNPEAALIGFDVGIGAYELFGIYSGV